MVSNDDAVEELDIENGLFQQEQLQKDEDFFAGLEMRNLHYEGPSGGDFVEEEDAKLRLQIDDDDDDDEEDEVEEEEAED